MHKTCLDPKFCQWLKRLIIRGWDSRPGAHRDSTGLDVQQKSKKYLQLVAETSEQTSLKHSIDSLKDLKETFCWLRNSKSSDRWSPYAWSEVLKLKVVCLQIQHFLSNQNTKRSKLWLCWWFNDDSEKAMLMIQNDLNTKLRIITWKETKLASFFFCFQWSRSKANASKISQRNSFLLKNSW